MSDDRVGYVVNRNINYTNICYLKCQFCAFSKGKLSESLRGVPYDLELPEIVRRAREAWDRGATEVCMQGGIHPDYTGETYLRICDAVKQALPEMHIHAFSPLEVSQGAKTLGTTVERFLGRLRDAGLGSLPGTAAEILDDGVRATLCPDKLRTEEWLAVIRAAHGLGIRTTSTIMYGHLESYASWARHLLRLRALQQETGGFTEFVPLPFVHMEAPIYLKGRARRGPTFREAVLMHAVSRLALHPFITNIQASWVKMGPDGLAACLRAGANDAGGTLMNESIPRPAGGELGQSSARRDGAPHPVAGSRAVAATTLYQDVADDRRGAWHEAAARAARPDAGAALPGGARGSSSGVRWAPWPNDLRPGSRVAVRAPRTVRPRSSGGSGPRGHAAWRPAAAGHSAGRPTAAGGNLAIAPGRLLYRSTWPSQLRQSSGGFGGSSVQSAARSRAVSRSSPIAGLYRLRGCASVA